jgi:hypothetical protein
VLVKYATISRQDCEYARWKTRTAFWFWKTDYGDRASPTNFIKIGKQLDLIMVRAQDVGFERIIVFGRGDSGVGIRRFVT